MLRAEDGTGHLFTLSYKAAIEPQQLAPLQAAQATLAVDFEEGEGGMSRVALRVYPADPAARGRAETV